jgi:ABC-type amino acid transport substrate-binding protein
MGDHMRLSRDTTDSSVGGMLRSGRTQRRWERWLWLVVAAACWLLAMRMIRDAWFHRATDPTWEQMQQNGVVRVCMDATYAPFGVQDASGRFYGYDVALMEELAQRWGVGAQFINIHFDGLYDALLAGKCDLILSALPYDETLTEDVLYSPSYFNAGLLLAVREDERRIRGVGGLAGRKVGVELGTTAHLEAQRLLEQARIPLQIVTSSSAEQALQGLLAGEVDGVIADSVSIYQFARQSAGLRNMEKFLSDEQYVMAVRPDSGYLWKRIADELARMKKECLLEALQDEWF